MATRLSALSRSAATDAVTARINAGAGPGLIRIYTGNRPASADDPTTGTLLVTITLDDPAFGPANNGVADLGGVPRSGVAVASGTAGWARVLDSVNGRVFDLFVTVTGGGGEIELASVAVSSGQTVQLTVGSYTTPTS